MGARRKCTQQKKNSLNTTTRKNKHESVAMQTQYTHTHTLWQPQTLTHTLIFFIKYPENPKINLHTQIFTLFKTETTYRNAKITTRAGRVNRTYPPHPILTYIPNLFMYIPVVNIIITIYYPFIHVYDYELIYQRDVKHRQTQTQILQARNRIQKAQTKTIKNQQEQKTHTHTTDYDTLNTLPNMKYNRFR